MIRLRCATGNAGKLREFRLAAGLAPVEIELLPGYREIPPCVEDGRTFEENAVIKALHYGRHASGLLFADDSGLEVDALDGAPGVFSARFSSMHPAVAGPPLPVDEANNRLLLEKLRGVENRSARFVCAIALAEGGTLLQARSGDSPSPEHVNLTGMCLLLVKAELLSIKLLCAFAAIAIIIKA